ncbi:hypothetical protein Shyhy01_01910 [Streptomyces hygroscopicus subsp. hygroscopicus]|nr:hypothetical protein Shyhy01_01910 [Streptomyces hygroscopicus subsp. hygroscopicus]
MRLAPKRLPGERVTISLRGMSGEPELALHGSVMTGPSPNTRIDPYSIFSGASSYQGLATGGPHPWRTLEPEDVYPCLLVLMPHYEALPLGRLAKDPDACGVLLERLRQWAGDQGLRSIAFEYLAPEAAVLTDALRAAGWPVVEFAARCDLHVTWSDFDGYMDTLSSRRRVRVRRELRALDEAGVRVATRALRDEEPELVDLRCQLVVKYGGTADPAKEASMIRRLRSCFGDDEITVVTAERGGKTLGFGVFVQDGETWMPTLAGADYTDPHSRLTYFATLFYKPIELAPERGIRIIPYGLGSWQAKQLRGCVAAPLYGAALRLDGHL